jgi:hypothetical protein
VEVVPVSDLVEYKRVGSGNIGRTSDGPIDGAGHGSRLVGPEVNLLQFSGNPADPRVITVSLAALQPTTLKGPFTALLYFGSGLGDLQRLEVDIPVNEVNEANRVPYVPGGGLRLSLLASSVRVQVRNDAAFEPSATGPLNTVTEAGVQFTASLGIGGDGGSGPPANRTIWGHWEAVGPGGLAPGGFVNVPLPVFARSFRVCRSNAAATVSYSQLDANASIVDGPYTLAAGEAGRPVEIVQNTQFIRLTNTGGVNIFKLGCVYQLGGF